MRSRYQYQDADGVYFLTMTAIEWLPIFIQPAACEVLIESLEFCRVNKGLRIHAYVIMDNHLHLIASGPDLPGTVRAFKGFTARRIVQLAQASGREWLLNQFEYHKLRHRSASTHQVWQEGAHPQLIQGDAMWWQKVEYIHNNPVRRGWVELPEHWRYSSASEFVLGKASVLAVDTLAI